MEFSGQKEVFSRAAGGKRIQKLEFRFGAFGAAVPLLIFVIWAVTTSVLGVSSEIGLVLGAVIGLAVGLFFCKSKWEDYAQGLFDGLAQPVGVIAMVAWFWAGMFAQVLQAGGLVEGLVWLGQASGVTGSLFVATTFVLASVFSTAVGTGYGTTVAFCTLMYPAGVATGADPTMLFAAILAGAVFGDNLAPVSDTTIVSATTQDADVPGVVRSRFKYSIAAAVPALILFAVFGGGGETEITDTTALQAMQESTSSCRTCVAHTVYPRHCPRPLRTTSDYFLDMGHCDFHSHCHRFEFGDDGRHYPFQPGVRTSMWKGL